MQEKILFSNYYGDMYSEEDIKEIILEDIHYGLVDFKEEDIDDEMISDYMRRFLDDEFYDFKENFRKELDSNYYVVTGTLGLWDGTHEGGKVIAGWYDLMNLLEDCDYIKFVDENGLLKVTGSHHDGTNYFQVKELTDKGYEYYKNNEYDLTRRDLCETLFNSEEYSRLPMLSKKVFGC